MPTQEALANSTQPIQVKRSDIAVTPLQCPLPNTKLWNLHPRVFLEIDKISNGIIRCPYCSTEYILVDG